MNSRKYAAACSKSKNSDVALIISSESDYYTTDEDLDQELVTQMEKHEEGNLVPLQLTGWRSYRNDSFDRVSCQLVQNIKSNPNNLKWLFYLKVNWIVKIR